MRLLLALACLALAGCVTTGSPAPQPPLVPLVSVTGLQGDKPSARDVPVLVEAFEQMAFADENRKQRGWLVRWEQETVEYQVDAAVASYSSMLDATAGLIGKVTGLSVREAPTGAVRFVELVNGSGPCDGTLWSDSDGRSERAVVRMLVFPHGHPLGRGCAVEELWQAMGLPGDTDLVAESMIRTHTRRLYHWPTWSDAVLLRTLYDRRLHAGMSRAAAMRVVPTIISELVDELSQVTAGR